MSLPRNRRRTLAFLALVAVVVAGWWGLRTEAPPVSAEPFLTWARTRAMPLRSVEAGRGFEDLRPLAALVGTARVVGLGEATHGTREFFQLKHRLLEFLVEEHGFTAFALETDFALATRVDAYVCGGPGDAAALVRGMRFWIWDTEEIVALVEWIRRHNLQPTTTRKVRFYGVDMQAPETPVAELVQYLAAVDGEAARRFGPLVARAKGLRSLRQEDQPVRVEVATAVRELIALLEDNRARFVAVTGEDAWRFARQQAEAALQALTMNETGSLAHRDAAMAKNLQWILAHEGPAGRVLLSAHNGHVMRRAGMLRDLLPLDFVPMGRRLRMQLGEDYVAVGFAFSQGEVRNLRNKSTTLGPAAPDSFDGVLSRVGPPVFALDLRAVADADAARWLQAPHATRCFGLNQNANGTEELRYADCFDAVVFFDRTTAARATGHQDTPPSSAKKPAAESR